MKIGVVRITKPKKPNFKYIHCTFTLFYTLITVFFLIAPIVCINYEIIFQSGLAGYTILLTGIMLSATMIGNETIMTRGIFYIYSIHLFSIIFLSFASAFSLSYYIWNDANILLSCSDQPHRNESVSLQSITSNERAIHSTILAEDQEFQVARAAKICRNEQGFATLLLVLIIITIILNIITILTYAWIKSWMRCLVPTVFPICG